MRRPQVAADYDFPREGQGREYPREIEMSVSGKTRRNDFHKKPHQKPEKRTFDK